MKRRKKHAAKGRKTKKKGRNVRMRAGTTHFRITAPEVKLLVGRVEEALDNLPPESLSKSKVEKIHKNISVATDEAAKPKDRKTAWQNVITIYTAIKVTGDAVEIVKKLWDALQSLKSILDF